MAPWWQGIADDFMDVPRAGHLLRVGVRLLLAALLGGLIGLNRQHSGKAAGLRTHMLVALGSAALVGVPALGGCRWRAWPGSSRASWPASASSAPGPSSRAATRSTSRA